MRCSNRNSLRFWCIQGGERVSDVRCPKESAQLALSVPRASQGPAAWRTRGETKRAHHTSLYCIRAVSSPPMTSNQSFSFARTFYFAQGGYPRLLCSAVSAHARLPQTRSREVCYLGSPFHHCFCRVRVGPDVIRVSPLTSLHRARSIGICIGPQMQI
jgi:hypothetical protein